MLCGIECYFYRYLLASCCCWSSLVAVEEGQTDPISSVDMYCSTDIPPSYVQCVQAEVEVLAYIGMQVLRVRVYVYSSSCLTAFTLAVSSACHCNAAAAAATSAAAAAAAHSSEHLVEF